ncbi:MAG: hypothetical protein COU09_01345 [Candidatus Harrisonbacteria bacterium CG10_big_fil_rev_8_21_14_0_10_44_23]|uniref:Phage holin family protein n=1 Tax=Candidatus Harrisonbacteria bacterium CG10_big_fil_rev_8_21_14_0_10_44_23 TaxID=1974585 RepID=A0A2H0UQE2_9BACT|nr:MAG: hypothetical protein COU09_01345 [Candidatus Harrisonbacteria bacterium CG10_big_fil_rev_8_21_14_0_10_44_23]
MEGAGWVRYNILMLGRFIMVYIVNGLALLAAAYFIPGFDLTGSIVAFLALVLILTLIHMILRPFIKLIFSPVIILTLGIFNLVINGAILFIVDIYSEHISIDGLMALLYSTLLISFVNLLFRGAKKKKKIDE